MNKDLQIPTDLHGRLEEACRDQGVPVASANRALLNYALDALDRGDIELAPAPPDPGAYAPDGVAVPPSPHAGEQDA